ncbi:hypothetical protein JTE90_001267 [Oedothorax gibbosus]|uniref:SEC14-like protein 2 n=1 Tax=Oedothorax gibbosus TaxID=931172 RepID=A0AAV6V3W4_9ARAC|nr:hypothetical protein JTE90_001267 [Oedothorax gibbosus]
MTWRESVTKDEEQAVEEFRRLTIKNCTSKMLEDETLFYRFMKARDFNMKNAQEMLEKHIAWRKEFHIDTMVTDYKPPAFLLKYGTISLIGFDKEGSIVRYIDVGRTDTLGVFKSCKIVELLKYSLWIFEKDLAELQKQSKKTEKPVNKVVYIYNFDEFSFANATNKKGLEYLVYHSRTFQDNYPEMVKCFAVINANSFFSMFFAVLKPWVAPVVLEKIRVFGSDGYQEFLRQFIDPDVLPVFLGGNRTDPDGNPACCSFIQYGKKVPEELYMQKNKRTLASVHGVKTLNVSRFSKSDIRYEVDKSGSFLEWEFETKNRDIGFGLYFKESEGSKTIELIPKQRMDTDYEPEVGMYKCEKPGTYIIVFDNSYSWIHSKDIFYKVKILGPQNDCDDY